MPAKSIEGTEVNFACRRVVQSKTQITRILSPSCIKRVDISRRNVPGACRLAGRLPRAASAGIRGRAHHVSGC
jgi:hypothetical protein